ncbi:hypothetical protein [Myroides injenensis]|uniref:hypothetical protein n=1 Tax=Myroides injenensis TaxID=1183151 RepID=UPI00028A06B6|nr:hypothetical protein [Myroides injenensis]
MKKLFTLLSIFTIVIGLNSCSSDDNDAIPAQGKSLEGTWESYQVSYIAYDKDGNEVHKGTNYPFSSMPFGKDPIVLEEFIINDKQNVIFKEVSKSGVETTEKASIIDNKNIVFDNKDRESRVISNFTIAVLTLKYKMVLGDTYADMTVTYTKK